MTASSKRMGKRTSLFCLCSFSSAAPTSSSTQELRIEFSDKKFVINANGVIDARSEPVADLQVFGGKPAAHAFLLKVGVQPLGEVVVFGGLRPNHFERCQKSLDSSQIGAVMATHHQFHSGHCRDCERLRGDLFEPLLGRNCSTQAIDEDVRIKKVH